MDILSHFFDAPILFLSTNSCYKIPRATPYRLRIQIKLWQ